MEKMFGPMMQQLLGKMSEDDKQRIKACCEKMATMCPGMNMESASEDDKKAMLENMRSFCSGKMKMMSACFSQSPVQPDQAGSSTCCS